MLFVCGDQMENVMKSKIRCLAIPILAALVVSGCSQNNDALMAELEAKLAKERKHNKELTEFLEQRMTSLEVKNGLLADEFETLKASQTEVVETALNVSNKVAQALQVEVAGLIENEIATKIEAALPDGRAGGGALANTIQSEIVAYEKKKAEEREAEREQQRIEAEERRAQEREERFQSQVAELGLNAQQSEQLRVAQETLRTSMSTLFTEARESGNFNRDTMREKMTELREANTQILSQFMTAEQVGSYNEMNDRGPWGRGGPGGRGGR